LLTTSTESAEEPEFGGLGGYGQIGHGICLEQMAESGAELAIEDGAPDLKQAIGAMAGPAHLLRFGHAAVDQEVGRAFGECRSDPLPGTMTFGVIGQPSALAGEIPVELPHSGPQPA
jgi:hypothetical protein